MAIFGLVHGAWHGAWSWELLSARMSARGHRTVAVDLPAGDPTAGPAECARIVATSLEGVSEPVILVGHSLGGLTIAGVTALRPVAHTVYLCALVPVSGRSWDETHLSEPPMDAGLGAEHFETTAGGGTLVNAAGASQFLYNECPPELAASAVARLRPQTYGITQMPQLGARKDRLVMRAWSKASVAKDLAHAAWIEIEGDHSPMLGRPDELAAILAAIAVQAELRT